MDRPETIIAIVVGILNFVALLFVGYQTFTTRKTLNLTNESVERERQVRTLTVLSQAGHYSELQASLQRWKRNMQDMIDNAQEIRLGLVEAPDSVRTQWGLDSPQGLIHRGVYENAPGWVSETLIAAAQYYFTCKSTLNSISSDEEPDFNQRALDSGLERAREGIERFDEMLALVEAALPAWYLESPARLGDDRFLTTSG